VVFHFAPVPENKGEVQGNSRYKENQISMPTEASLKKSRNSISAPNAEPQKDQAEHGIDFAFNPSNAPLQFFIHRLAAGTGRGNGTAGHSNRRC
jgi:hypothetical protein